MTLKKLLHLNMELKMNNIEIPHKNKSLSLFHINAYSHNKNFDDLQHLLSCTKTKFDIIAISETRIKKQVSLLNNLNFIIFFKIYSNKDSCRGYPSLHC